MGVEVDVFDLVEECLHGRCLGVDRHGAQRRVGREPQGRGVVEDGELPVGFQDSGLVDRDRTPLPVEIASGRRQRVDDPDAVGIPCDGGYCVRMRGGDAYLLLGCPSVGFDRAAYGQGVAGVVGQPSGSIEAVARDGEAGDGELGVERLVRFYAQGISFPSAVEWYFNLIAELGRQCIFVETYTGRDHWPNIYTGVFTLFLILLYLTNRGISWKKKLPRVLLLAFMALSFANNMLDFIWHGLHFPDSLPGRQSFLYSFLLLVLCFETFLHLKENRWYHVLVALVLDGAFLYAAYRWSDSELIGSDSFFTTAVFIVVYAVLLLVWYGGTAKVRDYVFLITSIVVITELTINFDMTGLDTVSRTSYVKDWKDYENVLEQAKKKESENSAVYFYRTEEMERKTKNDAALSGYYSATQFSSLMNINVSHIYQDLGMEGGKNFYCINGASPLISSMLSLKYVIADNAMEESPLRTLVASSGNTYLYENKYSLPLGFMVDDEVAERWDYKNGGGVSNQNELAELLGAQEEMLSVVPAESEVGVSTIQVTEDGYYFAAYSSATSDTLEEEVSDGRTKSFTKASHGYILDLGYAKSGDVIRIKNSNNERVDITAYQLNMDALDTAYETLNSQTMELTSFSDRKITGTIDVEKAGNLVFSIAREDGWTVYVDGKETEPETFAEAFISVPLTDGKHDIELIYTTPGLKTGAMISLGCLMLFLLSAFWRGKQEKNIVVSESLC